MLNDAQSAGAGGQVRVRIPATTANLGPGYDCLGLALGLYNTIELSVADETTVEITGEGAETLPRDQGHLVLSSAATLAIEAGIDVPCWKLVQENAIPLARGLGSSSAAIVGGLVAANALLGAGLSRRELLDLAARIEGHPDNVAPALMGGLTVCSTGSSLACIALPAPDISVVVAIPSFEVSTEAARRVLPREIPHADGVFNTCNAALTLAAFVSGEYDVLCQAMCDRLHQPYRAHLVPGFEQVLAAACAAGAHGTVLSGSGPTIAAFATCSHDEIARAMCAAFSAVRVQARSLILSVDSDGAKVF